jgi:hypothetical protein
MDEQMDGWFVRKVVCGEMEIKKKRGTGTR